MIDWSSLWESIKLFFAENWLTNVIALFMLVITTAGILIPYFRNKKLIPEKVSNSRTAIKNISSNTQTQIKTEPLFLMNRFKNQTCFVKKL